MSEDRADSSKEVRREYLDERRELINAEQSSSDQFDRTLITLSSGALGLSVAFIRFIAPQPGAATLWILKTTWTFFTLSLVLILISFLVSQYAYRRSRDLLDAAHSDKADPSGLNRPARATEILNLLSLAGFVLGVISLVGFAMSNLSVDLEGAMSKEKSGNRHSALGSSEGRGSVPPKPPVSQGQQQGQDSAGSASQGSKQGEQ